MKKELLFFLALTVYHFSFAQDSTEVEKIVGGFEKTNKIVIDSQCTTRKGMIVSNRGLNYFFANKIGSYLSQAGDISLFKHYATLNSADGELSINWNFENKDAEERIKALTTIGAKANISEGFGTIFSDNKFNNELGLTLKRTWFGRGVTNFDKCSQSSGMLRPMFRPSSQKLRMNAKRSFIIHSLEIEMENKARDFENSLSNMKKDELPHLTLDTERKRLRDEFYAKLKKEFEKKFAELEAKALDTDSAYNLIYTHWTTLSAYLPVTTEKFKVAPGFANNFSDEEIYPFKINLSHNRIWESQKHGRFFLFFDLGAFWNNSVATKDVEKINLNDYGNRGNGGDTLHYAELESEEAYIGDYDDFITPQMKLQGVWFPHKWKAGFSLSFEKSFGSYDPLNGKFGIPIRLNDKDGKPAVNFELQLRASDITRSLDDEKSFGKRLAVGISVGLPFSSIIY